MKASRNVAYYDQLAEQYPLFFLDFAADMEREGDWLDSVLRPRGVRSVLDASCGSGRQSIPLAKRGYDVTAVDPSEAMLREGRRASAEAGVEIAFRQAAFADLTSLFPAGRFDAVITMGNGLCHQESPEEIVHSLQSLRTCCRPDGLCLIGIKDFDAVQRERSRFHGYRIVEEGDEHRILFQVWSFEDPILVCGAFSLCKKSGRWSVRRAETREYMLGSCELARAAHEAGFTSVQRLAHPAEAVYLLEPGSATSARERLQASS